MTDAQKRLRELRDRQSRERQRMAELSREDSLTDETRTELDTIEKGTPDLERQLRAATLGVESEDREAVVETGTGKPEERERVQLRSRASLGRYLVAAGRGNLPQGAEAELSREAKLPDNAIPLELWDVPREQRQRETRAVTAAPGTVGVNLDPLRPQVFAPSVVDKLNVEMPMVPSGTFASGTITTAATADAVGAGDAVLETAAAFTVTTTVPKRVGASLNLRAEDIAAVGQANFESLLRQHISLVLSDELDDQLLNGDGQNDDLTGFFQRLLPNPAAPAATAETFDRMLAIAASGIDGLWAAMLSEVALVVGVDTYALSTRLFRDVAAADLGDVSFADYGASKLAGWWTNKRMPAKAAHIQQGILCRKGRSTMPTPMRTAVAPHWGYISVDDIYTGAAKAERRYVLSVLVGDVILVQPDAYKQVAFRVSV